MKGELLYTRFPAVQDRDDPTKCSMTQLTSLPPSSLTPHATQFAHDHNYHSYKEPQFSTLHYYFRHLLQFSIPPISATVKFLTRHAVCGLRRTHLLASGVRLWWSGRWCGFCESCFGLGIRGGPRTCPVTRARGFRTHLDSEDV